jgi:hypothetical protein
LIAAPAYLGGLDDVTQERLRREYFQEMAPEEVAQLEAIENSLETVLLARDQLRVHVASSYDWQQVSLLETGAATPEAA